MDYDRQWDRQWDRYKEAARLIPLSPVPPHRKSRPSKAKGITYPSKRLHGDEIRLLVLQPAQLWKRIRCSLKTVRLNNAPDFEALSYCWGDSTRGKTVSLEGEARFDVTDNLWHALRRLRLRSECRVLWIDSLCINQADLEERGQQIQLMLDIYQSAKTVIVWFGEPPGMSLNYYYHSVRKPNRKIYQWTRYRSTERREPTFKFKDCRKALESIASDVRPQWWDRAWVVQETIASRSAVVYIGRYQILWEDFANEFVRNLRGAMFMQDSTVRYKRGALVFECDWRHFFNRIEAMCEVSAWDLNKKQSLLDLVKVTQNFSATKPVDKIYGLLGPLKPGTIEFIAPDYRKPCPRVFAEATYASIKEGTFDILFLVTFYHRFVSGLPTWAVDYTVGESELLPDAFSWRSANPEDVQQADESVTLSSDARKLSAHGRLLDVAKASREFDWGGELLNGAHCHDMLRMALEQVRGGSPMPKWSASNDSNPEGIERTKTSEVERMTLESDRLDISLLVAISIWEAVVQPAATKCFIDLWRLHEVLNKIWLYCFDASPHISVFVTMKGFIGFVPGILAAGDAVMLFRGSCLPIILRPVAECYKFCGFAYVHGAVTEHKSCPSILADWWQSDLEDREFIII